MQMIQQAAAAALADIGSYEAARCCQRDCWLALRSASRSSRELLPVPLLAEGHIRCGQMAANKECLGRSCPLFVSGGKRRSAAVAPSTSPSPGVIAPSSRVRRI